MRDTARYGKSSGSGVVLGEDWVTPQGTVDSELRARRARRGVISINRSPLARKIIIFNLLGILVMVAGVLYLNPFRDSLVFQRETDLVAEAQLVANLFEATDALAQPAGAEGAAPGVTTSLMPVAAPRLDPETLLGSLDLSDGVDVFVFDAAEQLVATTVGRTRAKPAPVEGLKNNVRSTVITDLLNGVWEWVSAIVAPDDITVPKAGSESQARALAAAALGGTTQVSTGKDEVGGIVFSVAAPVLVDGGVAGVVALTSASGELDALVRSEREQVLQMFVIAILVSIGLSLVLASTIANPLSDLAAAAELGRDRNAGKVHPGRVRIPDLTGRPDEIGRLSSALRGMVAALYDRIDANEQFAADVAHEIKNPLASLRWM